MEPGGVDELQAERGGRCGPRGPPLRLWRLRRNMEIIYSIVFKTFKELVYYSKGITDHSLLFYMKMFRQFIHKSRVSDPGLFHLLDPDPGVAKMINFVSIIEDYLEV